MGALVAGYSAVSRSEPKIIAQEKIRGKLDVMVGINMIEPTASSLLF